MTVGSDEHARVVISRRRRERMYGWKGIAAGLGLAAACVVAGAVPAALASEGYLTSTQMGWLLPIGMLGTLVLGMALVMRWYYSDDPTARQPESPAAHLLPGLRSAPRPVEPVAVPQFGGPPDALAADARALRLAAAAESRLDFSVPAQRSVTDSIDLIVGGSVLVPLGVGVIAFTFDPSPRKEDQELLPICWAAFVAGSLLLAGLRWRRGRRRRAFQAAAAALAQELPGETLAGVAELVGWLNLNWAAASDPYDLFTTAQHVAVMSRVEGYPVLVDVEPDGFSGEDFSYEPRVLIYVAALWPPGVAPRADERAVGLALEAQADAGLLLRATDPRLRVLRREPATIPGLAGMVRYAVALAQAAGAPPATPDFAARARLEASLARY